MTQPDAMDWHLLLIGLAGRLSDPVVTRGRAHLAGDPTVNLAEELVAAIESELVPLFGLEIDFLGDALGWSDDAEQRLAQLAVTQVGSPLNCEFSPRPPSGHDTGSRGRLADQGAVGAAAAGDGAIGLWRSFRRSTVRPPSTGVTQVYVVEADEDADLIALTGAIQHAVGDCGVADPQVEVYPSGCELPSYHRLARANGELLWSRHADPDVRVAALFDEVDPVHGPRFRPDHPAVDDEEGPRLVDYLKGCEPLLLTTGRLPDVVDPSRGKVVPMSFRTDGSWVWSDATTYYLETHRLQPDPALVAHIRVLGHVPPIVDDVARHRAMAALRAPAGGPSV